ncbi:MAG: hypothetical protein WDM89_03295 [Rhizomicrobium sp.]
MLIGRAEMMTAQGIDTQVFGKDAEDLRVQGATVMFVAQGRQAVGIVAVQDPA